MNRTDYYGLTMLSIAARFGYYIIVQQLLNFPEIDVCIADKFGRTATTWAQSLGYEGIVGSISQHCPCQDACATQAAIPNARRDLSTGSNSFCDVCWADLREIWYNCNTCCGGFTICPDCRELVAHCLEESYGLNRVNKDYNRYQYTSSRQYSQLAVWLGSVCLASLFFKVYRSLPRACIQCRSTSYCAVGCLLLRLVRQSS